jgi:HEAT repeat protein
VLSLQHLAGVGAVLCLLWLVAVRRNGAAYLAGLMDILNTGRLDLSEEAVPFHDKSVERYMRRTLPAARTDELPYLLSLLPELKEADLAPEFRALLQRDASPLKVAAIDYLGSRGAPEDLPSIAVHLEHPDPQVRTAAVQAIPAPGGTAWTATLERCAEDPDPAVRAAAVAGLFDIGDSMGRGIAAAALQHMLASERPEMRIAAADALAHCRSEGLAQRLTDLLRDDNPAVRLAALAACRSHPDSRVIPEVIPLLTEPRTRAAAAETLVAFGPAALAHLIPYLNPERWNGAPEGRYRVPAILAKIGDPAACDALGMCLDAPDLRFRCEGIAAYCTLVSRMPLSKRVRSALHAALDRELQAAEERQQILKEMEPLSDTTLLCDALREEHRRHLRNVFTLLGTRTPGVDMDRIYRSLYSTDERRANAIEILDNVLERQVKGRLLRLIETGNAEDTPQKSGQPPSFDLLLRPAGSDWVIVGALYAAAGHRLKGYENAFHALLHHPNPVVRETALYAIGSVATPGVIRAVCGRMADDPDPGIRRFAEHLAVRQSIGGIPS